LCRCGFPRLRGDVGGISVAEVESDIDVGVRLIFDFFEMLLPQLFEQVIPLNDKIWKRAGT
jgi:hypothetical protein